MYAGAVWRCVTIKGQYQLVIHICRNISIQYGNFAVVNLVEFFDMTVRGLFTFALFLLGAGGVAAKPANPAPNLVRAIVPTPPTADPFYKVPDGLDKIKPGTILRHRPPSSPLGNFGNAIKLESSHQILYRTTDSKGKATATVLTVFVPPKADFTKVLSYQVAEDAAFLDCAPSYAFQLRHETKGTFLTEAEMILIQFGLNEGWVVISPDFIGPEAAFLANQLAGSAVLDGIRAAISSGDFTGIDKSPTVSLWGYSGGSLASLWAAEMQPDYAPELKIAGAAVGGIVPNITTVVTKVNGTAFAGLIPAGVLGLLNQYPELTPVLEEHLLPEYRDEFYKAKTQCLGTNTAVYANKDIVGMFDDRTLVYTNPIAVEIQAKNALGHGIPTIPLYVYKAIGDEISPIAETDALVDKYCKGGTSVQYHRAILSNHISLAIFGSFGAFAWLSDTMSGKRKQTGCTRR